LRPHSARDPSHGSGFRLAAPFSDRGAPPKRLNLAHAARTDGGKDFVGPEAGARGQCHLVLDYTPSNKNVYHYLLERRLWYCHRAAFEGVHASGVGFSRIGFSLWGSIRKEKQNQTG
jgi:hypothetical protein